jgi:ABC-type uncharacterized transport system permease subunit
VDTALLVGFLAAAVRVATPLLLAALGEAVCERGGVINLGIEGAMLAGALGATLGATAGGPWVGVAAAIGAGVLVSSVVALVSVRAGADQIITGTAVTLGAVGLTGAIYRQAYGSAGVGLSLPTFAVTPLPFIGSIPLVGPALFQQSVLTYLALAAVPALWWILYRTAWGLRLRAAGESAEHARAAGVAVRRVRTEAVLVAGGFAGLAGAALVLAQVGTFAENMTAGRGFIAIAIVVLGSWRPGRILGAALFFGAAMALQFLLQSFALGVPYQIFLMAPYLLTLLVLAGAVGQGRPPADLGRA